MTDLHDLWKQFKFLSPLDDIPPEEKIPLQKFLQKEHKLRETRRMQYLLKNSGIKRIKLLEDFDWKFNPKIPRDKIMEFANSPWIEKAANLVVIGPAGIGKSHITRSLCYRAIEKGYTAVCITSHDLVAKLNTAKNVYSLIDYYAKVKVFCLDELGYIFPSQEHANHIFQIISKRSETSATLVTTNMVPSTWGKIFDSATATAILDRLSFNGIFLTFEGRSYRNRQKD